jgi:hypothetical protein
VLPVYFNGFQAALLGRLSNLRTQKPGSTGSPDPLRAPFRFPLQLKLSLSLGRHSRSSLICGLHKSACVFVARQYDAACVWPALRRDQIEPSGA